MLIEIACCFIAYLLFRFFFFNSADAAAELGSSDTDAYFAVAARLEKLYGGKAFVGLRIPDADSATRLHVDLVLVTKREVMVVAVRNIAGFLEIAKDGNWVSTKDVKKKPKSFPDPVLEISKQISVLELYLEQRGEAVPKGHLVGKVILPNPHCRPAYSIESQPEVISSAKWKELKPESGSALSSWIKDAVHAGKSEVQDALYQKLQFILSTSPMWDRVELRGGRYILGEFVEFKGNSNDMLELSNLKRSKVGQIIIQKPTMLGLGRSRIQILYSTRDLRSEVTSSSEWKEIAVKPTTELVFEPLNSKKAQKLKLSSIASITLST